MPGRAALPSGGTRLHAHHGPRFSARPTELSWAPAHGTISLKLNKNLNSVVRKKRDPPVFRFGFVNVQRSRGIHVHVKTFRFFPRPFG